MLTCFVAVFVLKGVTTSLECKHTFAVLIVFWAAEFFLGIIQCMFHKLQFLNELCKKDAVLVYL